MTLSGSISSSKFISLFFNFIPSSLISSSSLDFSLHSSSSDVLPHGGQHFYFFLTTHGASPIENMRFRRGRAFTPTP